MHTHLQVDELYSFYHHQLELGHTLRFIDAIEFRSNVNNDVHINYEFKLVNTWYNNNHLELENLITLSANDVDKFVTQHEELITTIADINDT